MDKYITATEANQNLSSVLRDVAAGATYTVTSRGTPVAEIKPAGKKAKQPDSRKSMQAMLDRMKRLPGVVTGTYTRDDIYDRNW